MFTGIIERVGRVVDRKAVGELTRISIDAGPVAEGVKIGDSIAVNGACLTVTAARGQELFFDAVRESIDRTAIGDLGPGSAVNLERALRAGAGLDGHIVQGHVDDTGRVRALERRGDDVQLFVDCSRLFTDWLIEKGSIAIDGVSLTVVGVEESGFDVALIPHTLRETTLGDLEPGQRVNLEADVLGKYVKRYLDRILTSGASPG